MYTTPDDCNNKIMWEDFEATTQHNHINSDMKNKTLAITRICTIRNKILPLNFIPQLGQLLHSSKTPDLISEDGRRRRRINLKVGPLEIQYPKIENSRLGFISLFIRWLMQYPSLRLAPGAE